MRGGRAWRWLCEVDVAPLVAALPLLEWKPGKRGTYAMLDACPPGFPIDPVIERVSSLYPDRRRGTMLCFNRLIPRQIIEPHTDAHESRCRYRVHVPIVTNPRALMTIAGEVLHMAAGQAYEMDPTEEHMVLNAGSADRIHVFWNMVN